MLAIALDIRTKLDKISVCVNELKNKIPVTGKV